MVEKEQMKQNRVFSGVGGRLMLTPEGVIDSIVVHELCHRKHMNHSARFYAEVLRVLPEYRTYQRWLKEHGEMIMARVPEADG